jgi:NitT/TauT family transport system permease protein
MTDTRLSLPRLSPETPPVGGLALPGTDPAEVSGAFRPLDGLGDAPAVNSRRGRWSGVSVGRLALRLASVAVAVYAWQVLSSHQVDLWVRFSKVPPPSEVFTELRAQLGEGRFYSDLLASLRRILMGFGLATLTGVTAGVAIGRSKIASDLMRPVLEVVRPIPAIAWVPLAILLFPTGEQGIVFITYLAALFPVIVSTQHAVRALPNVWEDAVRTMGANRLLVLLRVVLPGALPGIFAGLSVAMGVGWICVVSAEMISGQFGIGYYTWQSYGLINYPGVIVGMLSIGVLGLASAAAVEVAGRRATRWLPRNEARRP